MQIWESLLFLWVKPIIKQRWPVIDPPQFLKTFQPFFKYGWPYLNSGVFPLLQKPWIKSFLPVYFCPVQYWIWHCSCSIKIKDQNWFSNNQKGLLFITLCVSYWDWKFLVHQYILKQCILFLSFYSTSWQIFKAVENN